MGAFSHKFSIAYSGETTDWNTQKVNGCKNRTDLPWQVWWGSYMSHAGCRRKSVCFCLSYFDSSNYGLCENGNTIKQCVWKNTFVAFLYRKVFKCVMRTHIKNKFYAPPALGRICTKNSKFWRFILMSHFCTDNGETCFAVPNFVKIAQRIVLGLYIPRCFNDKSEIWRERAKLAIVGTLMIDWLCGK